MFKDKEILEYLINIDNRTKTILDKLEVLEDRVWGIRNYLEEQEQKERENDKTINIQPKIQLNEEVPLLSMKNYENKGGWNETPPTQPRPEPPKGQDPVENKTKSKYKYGV